MSFFFDVTKSANSRQLSGIIRVSDRLRQALVTKIEYDLVPVLWNSRKQYFSIPDKATVVEMSKSDCFLTPEVFSSDERPGYHQFLEKCGVRSAAIFHDSIPLKYPDITWPKSVSRHPLYMQDLARFDHVFSVSAASQEDLVEYWERLNLRMRPHLSTLSLGADFFDRSKTKWHHEPHPVPSILNVGIIEPRKNQSELLDVAVRLWDSGLKFDLHFIGRTNPHYGKPIAKKIKQVRRGGYSVELHSKQSDKLLLELYSKARFTVFNSIAEGFGLPVVESLWLGIPCVCRKLPSLAGLSVGDACIMVGPEGSLHDSVCDWLVNPDEIERATLAARRLSLPTWLESANALLDWANSK